MFLIFYIFSSSFHSDKVFLVYLRATEKGDEELHGKPKTKDSKITEKKLFKNGHVW